MKSKTIALFTCLSALALSVTGCEGDTETKYKDATLHVGGSEVKLADVDDINNVALPHLVAGHTPISVTFNKGKNEANIVYDGVTSENFVVNEIESFKDKNLTLFIDGPGHKDFHLGLNVYPEGFPTIQANIINENQAKVTLGPQGFLLADFYENTNKETRTRDGFIAGLSIDGKLERYVRAPEVLMNPEQQIDKNGNITYTYFRQIEDDTPQGYIKGEFVVTDKNFNPVETIRSKGNKPVESHALHVYDNDDYLVLETDFPEVYGNTNHKAPQATTRLKRIKRGKEIWSYDPTKHGDMQKVINEDASPERINFVVNNGYDDPLHINAVDVDEDLGLIALSARTNDSILLIDSETGELKYRLSPDEKVSSFKPIDGTVIDFYKQHDVQITKTGEDTARLTLYDNGDLDIQGPAEMVSSGIVYELNLKDKTVKELESFHDGDQAGVYTGSFNRLDNGALVCFGMNKKKPIFASLFDNEGNVTARYTYTDKANINSYRWRVAVKDIYS